MSGGGVFQGGAERGFPAGGKPAQEGSGVGGRGWGREGEVGREREEGGDGEEEKRGGSGGGWVIGERIGSGDGGVAKEIAMKVAGGGGGAVEEGG